MLCKGTNKSNPNLETELRVRVFGNTTEYMQDIKENYPDLVPNKE